MRYYLELRLLPDEEVPLHFLWGRVYQQLHLGIVDTDSKGFGVSFPQYDVSCEPPRLGETLRVFGTEEALTKLDLAKWLSRFDGYVCLGGILPVPAEASSTTFTRHPASFQS